MTATYLPAWPDKFRLSLTLTIYSTYDQLLRRTFHLRNLKGESKAEQLVEAQAIMDGLAYELHYVTSHGVDKGIIKLNDKKVSETLYPDYKPVDGTKYYRYGVVLSFNYTSCYQWHNGRTGKWRILEEELSEGWQRRVLSRRKSITLRLPCHPDLRNRGKELFNYVDSNRKGWRFNCNHRDLVFKRFLARFYEEGNLCLGKRYAWAHETAHCQMRGVYWAPPKFNYEKVPKKSRLASQPVDDTEYVYLIRMGRTKNYKIGKSNDPAGRLVSLQTASPFKLKLLHTFKADNASNAEESLHIALNGQRLEGEWFQLSDQQRKALLQVMGFANGRFLSNKQTYTAQDLISLNCE